MRLLTLTVKIRTWDTSFFRTVLHRDMILKFVVMHATSRPPTTRPTLPRMALTRPVYVFVLYLSSPGISAKSYTGLLQCVRPVKERYSSGSILLALPCNLVTFLRHKLWPIPWE